MGVERVTVVAGRRPTSAAAMAATGRDLPAAGRHGLRHPGRRLEPARRAGLCRLRRGDCWRRVSSWAWPSTTSSAPAAAPGPTPAWSSGWRPRTRASPVTGINVRRPRAEQEGNVHALAQATAASARACRRRRARRVIGLDDWVGPGYSLPTPEMVEAVRMLARLEGVLLDPVYTGKAMAGLIDLARRGAFKAGRQRCSSSTPAARRRSSPTRTCCARHERPRTVGVIGGMGPAATLDFLGQGCTAATPARREQDHLRLIVDCNPQVPDRNAAMRGERAVARPGAGRDGPRPGARRGGGLVMPCNAAHAWAGDIEAAATLPFVSIIEAAVPTGRRALQPAAGASACSPPTAASRPASTRTPSPARAGGDDRRRPATGGVHGR